MGHAWKRLDRDGRRRYTAVYHDARGKRRSAGTFGTKREADKAWQQAEAKVAEGKLGDRRRGRQTFTQYVETVWLPNHEIEATTRERYTYSVHKHLMPYFGPMRLSDILPEHVRHWVTRQKEQGVSAGTIADGMTILSAIFTTALNDQIVFVHPCKGVRAPTVPRKPRTIVTPEQFDLIYRALPNADAQLLVETAIESGLRWGELTELRPSDLDLSTRMLTVSRAVVEVNPKFHPDGGRFLVKEYPKDKEYRRFKLNRQIVTKLKAHIAGPELGPHDLLFTMRTDQAAVPAALHAVPDPDGLGRTAPNAMGRRYKHGSLSGYSLGRCRCEHCRAAYAIYRGGRRSEGNDDPRTRRRRDTDGHIPRDWFRKVIWRPALEAAGLGIAVRMHDLRHAHASWLLAGGADLQVVKDRLGHGSLRTTEKYLHTLPDADDSALEAFARIRRRTSES